MTKSVLISGASTGIGKALSLNLDRHGYQVFAGVRNPRDAEALTKQASSWLIPVILDVTIPDTINAARAEISSKTGGELFCLVNNAGISVNGPLEFIPLQDFRQQMEVNLVGQLSLTQACMPLLRQGKGRVIFVSSVNGRLAVPFLGPYAASKAALISISDTLRLELAPWSIPVSVLIVGSVQTPIWEKAARTAGEVRRRMPPEATQLYFQAAKRSGESYRRVGRGGMKPEEVAMTTRRLMEKKRPNAYILIGRDALLYELMVKLLPIRLRDWLVRRSMGLLKKDT